MYFVIGICALPIILLIVHACSIAQHIKRFNRRLFFLRDRAAVVAVGLSRGHNGRTIFAVLACDEQQRIQYAEYIYGRSPYVSPTVVASLITLKCVALFTMPDLHLKAEIVFAFQNAACIIDLRLKKLLDMRDADAQQSRSAAQRTQNEYAISGWKVAANQDMRLKAQIEQ